MEVHAEKFEPYEGWSDDIAQLVWNCRPCGHFNHMPAVERLRKATKERTTA